MPQREISSHIQNATIHYQNGCFQLAAEYLSSCPTVNTPIKYECIKSIQQSLARLAIQADIALCQARTSDSQTKQTFNDALHLNLQYIKTLQTVLNHIYKKKFNHDNIRISFYIEISFHFIISGVSAIWLNLQLGSISSAIEIAIQTLRLAASSLHPFEEEFKSYTGASIKHNMNITNHPFYLQMNAEEALHHIHSHFNDIAIQNINNDYQIASLKGLKAITKMKHALRVLGLAIHQSNNSSSFKDIDIQAHDKKCQSQYLLTNALIHHGSDHTIEHNTYHKQQRDMYIQKAIQTMVGNPEPHCKLDSSTTEFFHYNLPKTIQILLSGLSNLSILSSLSTKTDNNSLEHEWHQNTYLQKSLIDLKILYSSSSTSIYSSVAATIRGKIFTTMSKTQQKKQDQIYSNQQALDCFQHALESIIHRHAKDYDSLNNENNAGCKEMSNNYEYLGKFKCLNVFFTRNRGMIVNTHLGFHLYTYLFIIITDMVSNIAECFVSLEEFSSAKECILHILQLLPSMNDNLLNDKCHPVTIFLFHDGIKRMTEHHQLHINNNQSDTEPHKQNLENLQLRSRYLWRLFELSIKIKDWTICDQITDLLYEHSNEIQNKTNDPNMKIHCYSFFSAKIYSQLQINRPSLALNTIQKWKTNSKSWNEPDSTCRDISLRNVHILFFNLLLNQYEAEIRIYMEDEYNSACVKINHKTINKDDLYRSVLLKKIKSRMEQIQQLLDNFMDHEITEKNEISFFGSMKNNYGILLMGAGERKNALSHFKDIVSLDSIAKRYAMTPHFNLSLLLWNEKLYEDASLVWMNARNLLKERGCKPVPSHELLNHLRFKLEEAIIQRSFIIATYSALKVDYEDNGVTYESMESSQIYGLDVIILTFIIEKWSKQIAISYAKKSGGITHDLDSYLDDDFKEG